MQVPPLGMLVPEQAMLPWSSGGVVLASQGSAASTQNTSSSSGTSSTSGVCNIPHTLNSKCIVRLPHPVWRKPPRSDHVHLEPSQALCGVKVGRKAIQHGILSMDAAVAHLCTG
mgnify:CR=1 FL=1